MSGVGPSVSPERAGLLPDETVAGLRAGFPITETHVFLNHAGVAPTSIAVVDAVHVWMDKLAHMGRPSFEEWEAEADACRERFAGLIGAEAAEVTFVRNTSHGLALVAAGLDWREGDRVAVATAIEYPSNVYPWQDLERRGIVAVDPVPVRDGGVEPADLEATLRPSTRLVAVSSAQYATGAVTDLDGVGALCRERGVLLCVDGIQTVGAVPTDVRRSGIHMLSADSHKWLLGMMGIGALFVDRSVVASLHPPLIGWRSMVDRWDFDHARFDLLPDAGRFEEGSLPYPLIAGFRAALDLLHDVGVEAVEGHVTALVEYLGAGLESIGCQVGPTTSVRRHILTFEHPSFPPDRLGEGLAREGVVVSVRRGRVRVSPHAYNTVSEMDRVVELVDGMCGGARVAGGHPG